MNCFCGHVLPARLDTVPSPFARRECYHPRSSLFEAMMPMRNSSDSLQMHVFPCACELDFLANLTLVLADDPGGCYLSENFSTVYRSS